MVCSSSPKSESLRCISGSDSEPEPAVSMEAKIALASTMPPLECSWQRSQQRSLRFSGRHGQP